MCQFRANRCSGVFPNEIDGSPVELARWPLTLLSGRDQKFVRASRAIDCTRSIVDKRGPQV
jgi:hypothetical protein